MASETFKEIFELHADFVGRVLRRHGVRQSELEDACQEVFLVVFRRQSEFEGRSSLRTWIYGIAVRTALGMRRRAYLRRELPSEVVELSAPASAFESCVHGEARELLSAALASLAPDKREAFVLYELEGMTLEEAGVALGAPLNTVRYRVYGARDEILAFVRKREQRAAARALQGPESRSAHWAAIKGTGS